MKDENKLSGFLKFFTEKNKKIIIALGLIGIALIFLSSFFKNTQSNNSNNSASSSVNTEEYAEKLEQSLMSIVQSIEGVGNVNIMVTLENGTETKYATQEKINSEVTQQNSQTKQSGDSEKKYIIVKDSDGTEHALAITEFEPTVKGVVIVCNGGDIPSVQERVTEAVTTALNISSKRVCVTKLSN